MSNIIEAQFLQTDLYFVKGMKNKNMLENMNATLSRRGPDEDGYYIDNNVAMAHKRLIVIDPEGRKTTYD